MQCGLPRQSGKSGGRPIMCPGRALIGYAEETARAAGFEKLVLCTNGVMTDNIRLYARLGFRETRRAREKGFSRVFMAKSLL